MFEGPFLASKFRSGFSEVGSNHMKSQCLLVTATAIGLALSSSALAQPGPPTGVPLGPPAGVPLGPPAGVPLGPPAFVAGLPPGPPDFVADLPSGGPPDFVADLRPDTPVGPPEGVPLGPPEGVPPEE